VDRHPNVSKEGGVYLKNHKDLHMFWKICKDLYKSEITFGGLRQSSESSTDLQTHMKAFRQHHKDLGMLLEVVERLGACTGVYKVITLQVVICG
jgi:hypothetical protein